MRFTYRESGVIGSSDGFSGFLRGGRLLQQRLAMKLSRST